MYIKLQGIRRIYMQMNRQKYDDMQMSRHKFVDMQMSRQKYVYMQIYMIGQCYDN